ncbi:type II secretion system F family protein [Asticcacaulis excentricus]|uniref:Type II/IV secretion system protein TadC n=1 Tax=Asticcacaulis excentricus TaxID=78587 RepID=A0A3G9G128_9CAUL|nr:type II secretion system F family protein [Asticcacaulis excentricus]BBF81010.1 type II/IV secretion system protein TadC [Asticcacaulis excentricus]
MKDLAYALIQPANMIAIAVAVLSFFAVLTLMRSSLSGEQLDKRMKAVAQRREELRRQSRQSMVQTSNSGLRQTDESLYKRIVDRLNLKTLLEDPKVVDKLAMAGFRGPKPITTFYFFRFLMPFVLGAFATFYIYVVNDFGQPPNIKILICVAMFVAGYYAPNIYISNIASKRRATIVSAFPDALDLLLICVEAGMSIEAALQKVSQEIGSASIELAEELSLLVAELSYLPERRMAYEGLARRTNYPGIKSVCTAMIQAEKYGTPLGTALRVMAKENRELRLSAAEKKAAALPAQLTVPMIVFFLPVLFVVILGPAALNIMDMMGKK